jgi:hypothetical protein
VNIISGRWGYCLLESRRLDRLVGPGMVICLEREVIKKKINDNTLRIFSTVCPFTYLTPQGPLHQRDSWTHLLSLVQQKGPVTLIIVSWVGLAYMYSFGCEFCATMCTFQGEKKKQSQFILACPLRVGRHFWIAPPKRRLLSIRISISP